MSIVVRVPIEIDDYKEKIIGNLSIRQLFFGGIAFASGIATYLSLNTISTNLATYGTLLVVAPSFCMGFIKPKGYNFETYVKIWLYCHLGKNKRVYETNPDKNILPIEVSKYRANIQTFLDYEQKAKLKSELENKNRNRKRGVIPIAQYKNKKTVRSKRSSKAEADLIKVTKKSIKRKRKTASKDIK